MNKTEELCRTKPFCHMLDENTCLTYSKGTLNIISSISPRVSTFLNCLVCRCLSIILAGLNKLYQIEVIPAGQGAKIIWHKANKTKISNHSFSSSVFKVPNILFDCFVLNQCQVDSLRLMKLFILARRGRGIFCLSKTSWKVEGKESTSIDGWFSEFDVSSTAQVSVNNLLSIFHCSQPHISLSSNPSIIPASYLS